MEGKQRKGNNAHRFIESLGWNEMEDIRSKKKATVSNSTDRGMDGIWLRESVCEDGLFM